MSERRQTHAPLPQRAASALEAWAPDHRLLSAQHLTAGLANTSFKLTLAARQRPVVLKLYTRDPASLGRTLALRRILPKDIPLPPLLHAQPDPAAHTGAFAVFDWVDGWPVDHLLGPDRPDDLPCPDRLATELGKDMGRLRACLDQVGFDASGFLDHSLAVADPFKTQKEAVLGYIAQCLDGLAGQRLGETLRQEVERYVQTHHALLDPLEGQHRLVHGDYKGCNLLALHRQGQWRISAVLDWEFAFSGSPLFDFATALRRTTHQSADFAQALAQSYSAHGGMLPTRWFATARLLDLTNLCGFLQRPGLSADRQRDIKALFQSYRTPSTQAV